MNDQDEQPVEGNSQPPANPTPTNETQPLGVSQPPVGTSLNQTSPNATPTSTPTPPPTTNNIGNTPYPINPKQGKSKKIIIIVIAVLLALMLLAGGGVVILLTHLNNKPEKVLADALTNTATDLLERKPTTTITKVVFESKEDATKVSIDLDTKNVGDNGEVAALVNFTNKDINLEVKAGAIMIGQDEFYFKVDNLRQAVRTTIQALTAQQNGPVSSAEASRMMRIFDPIITKVDGTWIQVTTSDLKNASSGAQSLDSCSEAVQQLRISDNDQKELKRLFGDNQFIVATEVYDKEDVEGSKSFHYLIDFNDDAAINFAKGAAKLSSFQRVIKDCNIDTDGIKKPETSSNQDKPDEMTVELWVNAESRRFSKIQVKARDNKMSVDFASSVKFETGDLKVEKPGEFITITQLQKDIEDILQNMQPTTTPTTRGLRPQSL